jgi:hypothetical protein
MGKDLWDFLIFFKGEIMTKRFTPKASDYTLRMADVQAKLSKLKQQVQALEEEERALKAYLIDFYDQGETEVDAGKAQLVVKYSESDRIYLDQEKAKAMLLAQGKKIPQFASIVVTFKVARA